MRVIAGSAGGIRLAVPKRGVRPTMDRVKAAIFSSLGDAVIGLRYAAGVEAAVPAAVRLAQAPPQQQIIEKFTIIFADPPYEKTETGESFTEKLLTNEVLPQLLETDGIFVLEKRPDEVLPEMKLWHMVRRKRYGATEVLLVSAVPKEFTRRSPASEARGEGGQSAIQ